MGLPHFHDSHTLMTPANGYPTRGTRPTRPGRRPRVPLPGQTSKPSPIFYESPRSGMSCWGGDGSMPGGVKMACHDPLGQGCSRFWQAKQASQNAMLMTILALHSGVTNDFCSHILMTPAPTPRYVMRCSGDGSIGRVTTPRGTMWGAPNSKML